MRLENERATEIQPKLLRALQEREFERLAATHTRKVNSSGGGNQPRSRKDDCGSRISQRFVFRLNVFPIRIPPLREWKEDIPLLVSYFVQEFAKQMQKKIEGIPAALMKGLSAWEWPGNIRELENFIERAVTLTRGKSLEAPLAELRKLTTDEPTHAPASQGQEDIVRIVKETINAQTVKRVLLTIMQSSNANRSCAHSPKAKDGLVGLMELPRMGVNRTTLLSRMKKFDTEPRLCG